ncbi:MAG: FmdB family transcriptional regulator [Acidobacteriota bacterium]|nr:FmdB family transcriptional regulator [Acidobacteriota bacterium]
MPIYEFQCSQCKERHEVIQRFSDAPLSHCPSCGGDMKKLPSSPAIQFKGSGFYKTDYASGSGSKSDNKGESKSESKGESESSKSESKSDSKSEAPAASKSETKSESKSESKSAE